MMEPNKLLKLFQIRNIEQNAPNYTYNNVFGTKTYNNVFGTKKNPDFLDLFHSMLRQDFDKK